MEKAKCTFCQEIITADLEEYKFGVPREDVTQIIKYEGEFHLWGSGGGDPYQAGVELENIHYCPMCGRKLEE